MRQQVKAEELRMLHICLKEYQPLDDAKVTLVVVNKRINQRFFEQTEELAICNPPAGTIVDASIVQSEGKSKIYDFFLISQTTTQGCVLPTHFFVSFDDSEMDKPMLQQLTYSLCYYYYNWSGSIKVPAPC
jgi:aubergine-like protein